VQTFVLMLALHLRHAGRGVTAAARVAASTFTQGGIMVRAAACCRACSARAVSVRWCALPVFPFTGTFTHDTDLQIFTFTLLNPTPGVNLAYLVLTRVEPMRGQVISSGGFGAVLNLYLA